MELFEEALLLYMHNAVRRSSPHRTFVWWWWWLQPRLLTSKISSSVLQRQLQVCRFMFHVTVLNIYGVDDDENDDRNRSREKYPVSVLQKQVQVWISVYVSCNGVAHLWELKYNHTVVISCVQWWWKWWPESFTWKVSSFCFTEAGKSMHVGFWFMWQCCTFVGVKL